MRRRSFRFAIALSLAALFLAGLSRLPWCVGLLAADRKAPTTLSLLEGERAPGLGPIEAAPAPPPREAQRPSGNPLWALPLRSLSATRDRPLFSPSRRPPAPAVAAAPVVEAPPTPRPAVAERPTLTLVGTIIGNGDKIAIFFDPNSRSTVRLRLGDSSAGWVLRSVESRDTILEKDHHSFTLSLPSPEDAPRQAPPPGDEQL